VVAGGFLVKYSLLEQYSLLVDLGVADQMYVYVFDYTTIAQVDMYCLLELKVGRLLVKYSLLSLLVKYSLLSLLVKYSLLSQPVAGVPRCGKARVLSPGG